VRAARYHVRVPDGTGSENAHRVFERRFELVARRDKNGKTVSFPLHAWLLEVEPADDTAFRMTLGLASDGASIRPDDVLEIMYGENARGAVVSREDLAIERAGRLVDPLFPSAAASPVPDVERAAG
jgi:hypothetical protein